MQNKLPTLSLDSALDDERLGERKEGGHGYTYLSLRAWWSAALYILLNFLALEV